MKEKGNINLRENQGPSKGWQTLIAHAGAKTEEKPRPCEQNPPDLPGTV